MTRLVVQGLSRTLRSPDRTLRVEMDDLDLDETLPCAVCGPSGSGKTTLLSMLGLAAAPDTLDAYRLTGEGHSLDLQPAITRRRGGALAAARADRFGYLAQQGALLPFLSLIDNIRVRQRLARRRDEAFARDLLDRLGLADKANAAPHQLSVGERQRAALARALSARPSVLIADEPTAALDPETAATVFSLCVEHARAFGAVLIIATHAVDLAAAAGLHMIRPTMSDGATGRVHRFAGAP